MRHTLLLILIATATAAAAPPATSPATQPAPVVVARGKDFIVQVVPIPDWGGWMVLQTNLATQSPTVLLATRPGDGVPRGFPREADVPEGPERWGAITGIWADAERLYVLGMVGKLGVDHRPHIPQWAWQGRPVLRVFFLSDGSALADVPLSKAEAEKAEAERSRSHTARERPSQSVGDRGDLIPVENGVSAYGTTIRFEGRKLVKQEAATRPTTAP